jgi:hypothetical protein
MAETSTTSNSEKTQPYLTSAAATMLGAGELAIAFRLRRTMTAQLSGA